MSRAFIQEQRRLLGIDEEREQEENLPNTVKESDQQKREAEIMSRIMEAPQLTESPTSEPIPEEEKEHREVQEKVGFISNFADAVRSINPMAGLREAAETSAALGETVVQSAYAMAGSIHGTVEGSAAAISQGIEELPSVEDRAERMRANAKQTIGNVPSSLNLKPEELAVADQYVKDKAQLEQLSTGNLFLKEYRDVIEKNIYNYTPLTDRGQAITETLGEGFAKFEEWGSEVGDKVYEETESPAMATMASTSIAGIPYVVPFYFGRMGRKATEVKQRRARLKRYGKTKSAKDEARRQGRNVKSEPTDPQMDLQTIPARMSPDQIRRRVDNFPDENSMLNQGYRSADEVVSKFKGTAQQRKVVLTKGQDGTLRIQDGAAELYARNRVKNSKRKPLDVEIVEMTDAEGFNTRASNKVKEVIEETERAKEASNKGQIKRAFQREVFDDKAPVVEALEGAGEAGRQAIRDLRLTAGATPRGKLKWQGWEDRIYGGLTRQDNNVLDEIIFSERIRQIDRIHGEGKIKHPGNITGTDATNRLKAIKSEVGSENYAKLETRANDYFNAARQQLDELYVEGIIPENLYNKLKGDVYQPRKLIETLDRSSEQSVKGGEPVTVSDSGIRPLDKGTGRMLETDSRRLMAEYTIRMQNRIMRNQANRSLAGVAEEAPQASEWLRKPEVTQRDNNGFAKKIKVADRSGKERTKPPEAPEGFVRMDYWENGQQQPMFMEAGVARGWTETNHPVNSNVANVWRRLSGSSIVKPMATGYNPGFAVLNLPRDLAHIYLASNQYSILPSKFGFQVGKDLAATARDAWKKDGRYLEYINEGGGMDFLTHQGQSSGILRSDTVGQGATRGSVRGRHIKEAASKINEFSEIWTRLALRERARRNGMSPVDATYEARSYLDFSQGGNLVKGTDHMVPYLNAATQAFRTGITENLKKGRRGRFAAKVVMANEPIVYTMMNNAMVNPEGYKQIDDKTRHENLIFMMPESFNYKDPRTGEEKSRYLAMRKDNVMVPFTAPLQTLMEKYAFGITPKKDTLEQIQTLMGSSLPVVPTETTVPTADALRTYISNYDMFWDRKIWPGQDVRPEDERQRLPNVPTPPMWVEMGEALNMSPVRAQAAVRKIFPYNDYLDGALFGVNKAMEGMRPDEKQRTIDQWIQRAPMLNRIFKETHPMARRQTDIEEAMQESGSRQHNLNSEVDRKFWMWTQGDTSTNDFVQWRDTLEPEQRSRAQKRWELNRTLHRVFSQPGNEPGVGNIPGKSWWLGLSNTDDVARAQAFYEEWKEQPTEKRRRMERIAHQLSGTNRPFFSSRARQEFERLKSQRGTERNDPD